MLLVLITILILIHLLIWNVIRFLLCCSPRKMVESFHYNFTTLVSLSDTTITRQYFCQHFITQWLTLKNVVMELLSELSLKNICCLKIICLQYMWPRPWLLSNWLCWVVTAVMILHPLLPHTGSHSAGNVSIDHSDNQHSVLQCGHGLSRYQQTPRTH